MCFYNCYNVFIKNSMSLQWSMCHFLLLKKETSLIFGWCYLIPIISHQLLSMLDCNIFLFKCMSLYHLSSKKISMYLPFLFLQFFNSTLLTLYQSKSLEFEPCLYHHVLFKLIISCIGPQLFRGSLSPHNGEC